jgi:type VI secretion system secreted protein VgrG
MHMLAVQHSVAFQPLDEFDERISIPAELQPIGDKVIAYAERGLSAPLNAQESRLLHGYYIHRSANWTTSRGLLINRPRSGGRAVYPDQPQKGYPQ